MGSKANEVKKQFISAGGGRGNRVARKLRAQEIKTNPQAAETDCGEASCDREHGTAGDLPLPSRIGPQFAPTRRAPMPQFARANEYPEFRPIRRNGGSRFRPPIES